MKTILKFFGAIVGIILALLVFFLIIGLLNPDYESYDPINIQEQAKTEVIPEDSELVGHYDNVSLRQIQRARTLVLEGNTKALNQKDTLYADGQPVGTINQKLTSLDYIFNDGTSDLLTISYADDNLELEGHEVDYGGSRFLKDADGNILEYCTEIFVKEMPGQRDPQDEWFYYHRDPDTDTYYRASWWYNGIFSQPDHDNNLVFNKDGRVEILFSYEQLYQTGILDQSGLNYRIMMDCKDNGTIDALDKIQMLLTYYAKVRDNIHDVDDDD